MGQPGEQILTRLPFLCIEILSPGDQVKCVQERIDDYLAMGVAYVWVFDPSTTSKARFSAPKALPSNSPRRNFLLILLCYKRREPQKGQHGSCWSRARAILMRSVAMDCGLCRSARTRRAAGLELGRNFRGA